MHNAQLFRSLLWSQNVLAHIKKVNLVVEEEVGEGEEEEEEEEEEKVIRRVVMILEWLE